LPSGARLSSVISEAPPGSVLEFPKDFWFIQRGESVIKWTRDDVGLFEYYVAEADEEGFSGLKELFRPGPPFTCRYLVQGTDASCLSRDNSEVEDCPAVMFQGRSSCLPPGVKYVTVDEPPPPDAGAPIPRKVGHITRGNSVIRSLMSSTIS
jgi:hypothetical protein